MPAKTTTKNTAAKETAAVIAEGEQVEKPDAGAKKSTSASAKSTSTAKSTSGASKSTSTKKTSTSTSKSTSTKTTTSASKSTSAKTTTSASKSTSAKSTTSASKSTSAKSTASASKSTSAKSASGAKKTSGAKSAASAKKSTSAKPSVHEQKTEVAESVNEPAAEVTATDTAAVEQSVDNATTVTEAIAPEVEKEVAVTDPETTATIDAQADVEVKSDAEKTTAENTVAEKGADDAILRVEHLKKYFAIKNNFFGKPIRFLKAVDDVSFTVGGGKTIGVVGESGCGKTTLGRTILKLYDSDGGKIYFDGNDITDLSRKQMMKYRTQIQLIFQDPYSSLPPRMTIGQIISEPVAVHKIVPKAELYNYVLSVMKMCGLQPQYYDRYPHEFSGGQRQRICIARALAVKPKLVICDEPVSALDVSIQAQIINLLKDLQKSMGLTYVFISHDLSVVKYITDQILVMYLGNAMEHAETDEIFQNPLHPYTQALFSAVPVPDPTVKMQRIILAGDIPSPANPPEGCKFHTRCAKCMDVCKFKTPGTVEARPGHFVTCHLYDEEVMAHLDEYSAEYAQIQAERQRKLEEERIKKENGKLYKFKTKVLGIFRRKKSDNAAANGNGTAASDGANGENVDGASASGAAPQATVEASEGQEKEA